ncbi:ATPase, partial [Escherichia coli]|nr:ATPase [Escherichia coli]
SAKGLVETLGSWRDSISILNERIVDKSLDKLINTINTYLSSRSGSSWPAKPVVSEIELLINGFRDAYTALGGDEQELLPKSEDAPMRFKGD